MKFSILYLTIDRYPDCIVNLSKNMSKSGITNAADIEILWCDNGSQNKQVVAELSEHPMITYKRINRENEGIARTLNQLMLRAKGQYIVQLGNDYNLPQDWLRTIGVYADSMPNTGMIGIPWSNSHLRPIQKVNGKDVHLADYEHPLFGVKLKTRALLDKVGAFDEKLHPYGLEDSDYHQRACLAGFHNYYIPGLKSEHLGSDVGQKTEYRQMKDFSMKANGPYFVTKDYKRFGYYQPWPAKNEGY